MNSSCFQIDHDAGWLKEKARGSLSIDRISRVGSYHTYPKGRGIL